MIITPFPNPMTAADSPLYLIASTITDLLNSDPYFVDITVNHRMEGVIEDDFEDALSGLATKDGKSGLYVEVRAPVVLSNDVEGMGQGLERVGVQVAVHEDVLVNRSENGTNKIPDAVVLMVLQLLHCWQVPGLGMLLTRGRVNMTVEQNADGADILIANLEGNMELTQPTRVQNLTLTLDQTSPSTVDLTLATPTAGAAIYYVVQAPGALPRIPSEYSAGLASNPFGVLYSGTVNITVQEGSQIIAMGYKSGLLPSRPKRGIVTLEEGPDTVQAFSKTSAGEETITVQWSSQAVDRFLLEIKPVADSFDGVTLYEVMGASEYTFTGLAFNTSYKARIRAELNEISGPWTTLTPIMTAPRLPGFNASGFGSIIGLELDPVDPDEGPLALVYDAIIDGEAFQSDISFPWTGSGFAGGMHTVALRVSNAQETVQSNDFGINL